MGASHVVTFLLISYAGNPGTTGQSAHVEQGLGSRLAHVELPGEPMFSDMCVVIINVLVRSGRAHAWMGVIYYVFSCTFIPGIFSLDFLRCSACTFSLSLFLACIFSHCIFFFCINSLVVFSGWPGYLSVQGGRVHKHVVVMIGILILFLFLFLFLWEMCVPALRDGRVSASAVYDGRSSINGRTCVSEVSSDSILCEFEDDTSTSA